METLLGLTFHNFAWFLLFMNDASRELATTRAASGAGPWSAGRLRVEHGPGNVLMLVYQGTDADLLKRLQERAPGANTMLHARFGQEVNRLVWRLLGADVEHDDLVQDIFEKLMRTTHQVREPDALVGWVRAVTVNAVRSELRKRKVRRLFFRSESERAEPVRDGVGTAEGREGLKKLYRILDVMPADDRIAFVLRYVEGLSVPEVAEQCNCSLATVKRRIARAQGQLAALRESYMDGATPASEEDSNDHL
jgi:RNA polymerase sigma-70 factor (ECF subfamily)